MKRLVALFLLGGTLVPAFGESPMPPVDFRGDFRYRIEYSQEDGKADRYRHRIRLRAGIETAPSEELKIGARLSTSEKNDPISANQTLGEGGSRKDVYIDLAYLDWHPNAIRNLHLIAGKMENPFLRVCDLVWDNDLTPEGAAVQYSVGGPALKGLLNAGSFWVEERSDTTDDAFLHGIQLAARGKQDRLNALAGVGYYYFDNLEGYPVLDVRAKSRATASGFGNDTVLQKETVDGVERTKDVLYATGFEVAEAVAEVGMDFAVPVALHGTYAVNEAADREDTAYLVGLRVGRLQDPGSCEFGYSYREVEANAVLGAWSDNDHNGGGTDSRGHKLYASRQMSKAVRGALTAYFTEKNFSRDPVDTERFFAEVSVRF